MMKATLLQIFDQLRRQIWGEFPPEKRKPELLKNIRKNWFFPISVIGIIGLNSRFSLPFFLGGAITFLGAVLIASQIPSLLDWEKGHSNALRIFSLLTAIGICWGEKNSFYNCWSISPRAMALQDRFPALQDGLSVLAIVLAVIGICFAYFWTLAFWKKFLKSVYESKLLSDISLVERVIYGVLVLSTLGWMIYSFLQTNAFYEMSYEDSITTAAIYTGDSSILLFPDNAFFTLSHSENDIRQPLFAVFAAPIIGLPYLLGRLIGASPTVEAILLQGVQVIILFAAHFILAKMMKLDSRKRICFMLLISLNYFHMLFTLMMEQYIFAYFWLVFCMYLISEGRESRIFALYGAGGTLLPSLVLTPFASMNAPLKNFRAWFTDVVQYGLGFIALMLVFCRLDTIFGVVKKLSVLSGYCGNKLTFADKFFQYTDFVQGCIFSPDAGSKTVTATLSSWQLSESTGINLIGVALFLLVVISAIWNRDKKSSLFAIAWVVLSVIMLLFFGWGTSENGLILYALYFGWAFFVLLFQLVEKIESKLNVKFFLPAFSFCGVVGLAALNSSAIVEMVRFAIRYFPI